MPDAPLRHCLEPACHELVVRGRCGVHTSRVKAFREQEAGHRWYDTANWKRLRDRVRYMEEPFCRQCGRISEQVDHVVPHRGDAALFWDRENLQGLCARCHGVKSQREG